MTAEAGREPSKDNASELPVRDGFDSYSAESGHRIAEGGRGEKAEFDCRDAAREKAHPLAALGLANCHLLGSGDSQIWGT